MSYISQIDLTKLEPQFKEDITTLLDESPYKWYITSGFRSIEEQAILYRRYQNGGPLAAAPGKSAHNFGLAVDLACDHSGPSWDISNPAWNWLFTAVRKHPRLHSLKDYGDFDHVERYRWWEHKPPES